MSGESKMVTENFKRCTTTNYVESSQQPEGDQPKAPAIGVFFSGEQLCVIQDEEIIPVNVIGIKLDRVHFRRQFIDEYDGTLSEWVEEFGTIIEGKPPVDYLGPKYSTNFYIRADES